MKIRCPYLSIPTKKSALMLLLYQVSLEDPIYSITSLSYMRRRGQSQIQNSCMKIADLTSLTHPWQSGILSRKSLLKQPRVSKIQLFQKLLPSQCKIMPTVAKDRVGLETLTFVNIETSLTSLCNPQGKSKFTALSLGKATLISRETKIHLKKILGSEDISTLTT